MMNNIAKKLAVAGMAASTVLSATWLIIPHEGEVKNSAGQHVVYKDPVGIITYCWGITGKDMYGKLPKVGDTYTEQECAIMFADKMRSFEKSVDAAVTVAYASPYQRAALISFTYNVGEGALRKSTLLNRLNSGDHVGACEQLTRWVYASGKKLNGLVVRRSQEMQWCLGHVSDDIKVSFEDILSLTRETREQEDADAIPTH